MLLRKKESALIIHSAMETWNGNTLSSEISSFYLLFRTFRNSLDSDPATPLVSDTKIRNT